MAKIAKIKWNNINGGTDRTDVYPITSDRAVYNADNKTMRQVIRERGVVNISTYFTYDGTPEKLTLETALKKITEENRCPGFLATILTTEDEWWTFRYNAYTVDDASWNNTDNWSPFHAGWLKTDTTSEDPETPLHLEWIVKNYIYTLKGWIDAVSTERNGYFTAEDYKKFLQALEDIKNLQERMAAAEATIKDHESRLVSAEASIKDHESRLVSAEGRISSAESRISSAESSINSINSSITSINSSISGLQSSVNNISSSISSITGDISKLQKLLEELQKTVGSLPTDAGVTQIKATSLSSIITAMPTGFVSGQVEMQIGIDETALNAWLVANGYGGGDTPIESDIAIVWVGFGSYGISPYGSINRSDLYPSSNYGTPKVGDAILWFYSANGSTTLTVTIAEVTSVSSSTISVTSRNSFSINTSGGSEEGGAVDSVQIQNGDTTGILTVSPTTAQSGAVVVNIGIDGDKLKTWLTNNGFAGGEVNLYPDVSTGQSNPTDIYFTSNQLITGSVSGSFTMTFHSTNGVAGAEVQIILQAGSSGATVTIAGTYAIVTDEYTTVTVGANKYVELNAIYDGSRIYVRSSSKES